MCLAMLLESDKAFPHIVHTQFLSVAASTAPDVLGGPISSSPGSWSARTSCRLRLLPSGMEELWLVL